MTLRIEHEVYTVGRAIADDQGRFALEYDGGWQTLQFAFPVSATLPLRRTFWPGNLAHPFFANLLPEGLARETICRRLGISYDNDVALLTALGNDTAGALKFVREGEAPAPRPRVPLTEGVLADWARGEPVFPEDGPPIRLSLAGAQHKLSVVSTPSGWAIPASDEASTHILKFDSPRFRHLSVNEFLTTKFAAALGLEVVDVALEGGKATFLSVVRYDRRAEDANVVRLHQEDFCQLRGVLPRFKYEAEGGPTLRDVADLTRALSARGAGDVLRLLRWVVFCALAGNADGHAKNLAMLYTGKRAELAPFYDLVCTRAYSGIDRNLAFAIGGARDPDKLNDGAWTRLAADLGVQPRLVRREVERQLDTYESAFELAREALEGRNAATADAIARVVSKRARAMGAGLGRR